MDRLDTDGQRATHEWYVISGVFTLPVYKGSVTPAVVDALLESDDHLQTLRGMAAAGQITTLGTTSVILRLVDTPRKFHFHKTLEQQPPSNRYLEPSAAKALTYKLKTGGTKLGELVPKAWAKDRAGFARHLEKEFKAHMQLP